MNATVDTWRQTLVMELRLRDVPGVRIGEIMAEVDSHCADSGEDPCDAFGDPVAYARSLDVPLPNQSGRAFRGAVQTFAGLGGILGLLAGATALIDGEPAVISAGHVAAAVVAASAIAAWLLLRRAAALPAVVVTGMLGATLPMALWPTPVVDLPAAPVTVVGAGLFLAGFWSTMFKRLEADLVVDPRTGAPTERPPRWLLPLLRWGLPAMLLLTVAGGVCAAALSH